MAQDIKQTVTFNARPGVIFDHLMDSRKHSAFTGAPAKISRTSGGAFSCFGGQISGVTLDTVNNKLIVQAWRGKGWSKDAWSIVSISLAGAPGGKCKLKLTHSGVPASGVKGVTEGWKSHYWTPLKDYLKAQSAKPKPKAKAKAKAKPKATKAKAAVKKAATKKAAVKKAAVKKAAPKKAAVKKAAPRKAAPKKKAVKRKAAKK